MTDVEEKIFISVSGQCFPILYKYKMDSNQYSHQISSTKPIDQAAEERIKKVHAAHRLD